MQQATLKEHRDLTLPKSVRSFSLGNEVPDTVKNTIRIVADFKDNWQEQTSEIIGFDLFAQTSGARGVSLPITEEELIQMLEFVRSHKGKKYSMRSES